MRARHFFHAIPWLLQGTLLVIVYRVPPEVEGWDVALWVPLTILCQMGIFYLYYLILIPNYLHSRKLRFWLYTIGILILYPLIKMGIDYLFGLRSPSVIVVDIESDNPYNVEAASLAIEYLRRFMTPFFFIPLAIITRFSADWFQNYKRQGELEAQNLKSELALLRTQINPHFLFNTLNNIDSMVYKVAPKASDAIIKLSEIMRYMLYEANTDRVTLAQEIRHLYSFIDLQKIRIAEAQIQCDVQVEKDQLQVAPMLFIPFVENAFKHGVRKGGVMTIGIELHQKDRDITFSVVNDYDEEPMSKQDKVGGIGLQNVRRRLVLLYPEEHHLSIEKTGEKHIVKLTLSL